MNNVIFYVPIKPLTSRQLLVTVFFVPESRYYLSPRIQGPSVKTFNTVIRACKLIRVAELDKIQELSCSRVCRRRRLDTFKNK